MDASWYNFAATRRRKSNLGRESTATEAEFDSLFRIQHETQIHGHDPTTCSDYYSLAD
jgi:hypothetical protein